MKKAFIISSFNWYENRLKYVESLFRSKGYKVEIWNSDFVHIKKDYERPFDNINYIHVRKYKKNFSIDRIRSHMGFSKEVLRLLNNNKPDVVYATLPPNSIAWACSKYKKQNNKVKLIYDVIDMWPESYTASKLLSFPFMLWGNLRDNNLTYADHVFTECSLYHSFLKSNIKKKLSTLHLCRSKEEFTSIPVWDGSFVRIGYLGSINNIIDIDIIKRIVELIAKRKKVIIEIVGGGESKDILVNSLKEVGADVNYYGYIFDKLKMQSIMGNCHFAINIMKPSVCVGLTIKSMDYFQMGIPLLNTIKGDTWELVNCHNCGFNVEDEEMVASNIYNLSANQYISMRKRTQKVFLDNFTLEAFNKDLALGLNCL